MFAPQEDEEFWLKTVKDINPISKPQVIVKVSKPQLPKLNPHRLYATKQEFTSHSKYLDDNKFGGIDSATLRKFKKEEFKTEAVLDLHGLTEDVAFEKVDEFIPRCYAQGKRCIIIITGKGSAHKDEDIFTVKGVLRKSVPQWLNMPRLRSMILVYKHPSERLGGSGALYILLKRNKEI